jgi:UDP-N-acetylglucosamine--N-acetylmuramyl-(pentapeptide) pyrophosphoryl-undecaprenol N-acetylglucosamine transferase
MAGGTGGHIYPALAVAAYLRRHDVPLLWLGTRRGLEARLVPEAGYSLLTITISGLRGKNVATLVLAPFKLMLALWQSLVLMLRIRPAAVLGMGGFASGPGGLAAWLLRIPLLLHEQNAILGLTNRLLAPLASRCMEAFPGTFGRPAAIHTGNPVRAAIAALAVPRERMQGRNGPLRLLVLGGSLGAAALNRLVPEALGLLASESPGDVEVWHQAGGQHREATVERYAAVRVDARVEPYVDDMAAAYAWADLVICRAGAMTIAELAAAGVAAVLVPYPHAVDDHQTANAGYLLAAGAALLIQERDLTPSGLAALLRELATQRPKLLEMADAARRLAKFDAAEQVGRRCMEAAYA